MTNAATSRFIASMQRALIKWGEPCTYIRPTPDYSVNAGKPWAPGDDMTTNKWPGIKVIWDFTPSIRYQQIVTDKALDIPAGLKLAFIGAQVFDVQREDLIIRSDGVTIWSVEGAEALDVGAATILWKLTLCQ